MGGVGAAKVDLSPRHEVEAVCTSPHPQGMGEAGIGVGLVKFLVGAGVVEFTISPTPRGGWYGWSCYIVPGLKEEGSSILGELEKFLEKMLLLKILIIKYKILQI